MSTCYVSTTETASGHLEPKLLREVFGCPDFSSSILLLLLFILSIQIGVLGVGWGGVGDRGGIGARKRLP